MENKRKINKQEKKQELKRREELEKLIEKTSKEIKTTVESAKEILPKGTETFIDYYKIKMEVDKESNEIIKSIAEFYLDEDIIKNVPYVNQKTKVDKITVSSLLFQMKTAEHAIIKLLDEIDNGNLHPRTFEVLAALQRSKMEIVKHLAQFMITMENGYKSFQQDYQIKKSELIETDDEDETFRTRGSKVLIQAIQKLTNKETGEFEDFKKEKNNLKGDNNANIYKDME